MKKNSSMGINKSKDVVIAGFYRPAVLALRQLFTIGHDPEDVLLVTYNVEGEDRRNAELLSFADKTGVEYTTDPIGSDSVRERITALDPTVLFSLYFRNKIPMSLLDQIPCGGVNLHASLLPRHKGQYPVSHALAAGDDITGFTYHYMTATFDEGRVVVQRDVPIRQNDTAYSLYHRVIYAALRVFPTVYERVVLDRVRGEEQSDGGCYHSNLPNDNRIDPAWSDEKIDRFIRSMYFPPYRPPVVEINGTEHEVISLSQYHRLISDT